MQSKLVFKHVLFSACLLSFSLSACVPEQASVVSTGTPLSLPTENLSTAMPSPSVPSLPTGMTEVAFVKDGNIQVWDEATQQTRTIVNTGDVLSVTTSDDGQMIAFTRGSWVGDVLGGYEQFALWATDRDGGNPRELVSALDLRQRIHPSERDSSNFFQLSWVPKSHQLIFSGTKYIVQGEGLSHAIPQGAYLVDTDKGSVTVLAEATENLRFLPSPDGKQIALMSPIDVDFINADGSNRREDVLTYAEVGLAGPLFPTGAWTQDSRAFVMSGSFEQDPSYNVNYTIWRIPMDGSSPEALATVTGSHPSSVTFSPDGKSASFLQATDQQPAEITGWFITPLIPEAGSLALPYYGKKSSYANLHWSPTNDAFAIKEQDLLQLCPNATQDSQVCGEPIHLGSGIITALQWVDTSRFLVEGIEPNTLSLGNIDGTITPIVTWTEGQRWTENDILSGWSFYIPR
jgi:dipeptidyl aminopeptidase/acylaminoacyl peptidase